MALSQILSKFLATVTPAFSFGGIATAAGRVCAQIDNTVVRATRGFVAVKLKAGTTPTANSLFKVYLIRNSNDATNIQAGASGTAPTLIGTVDAAVAVEPTNATQIGWIDVTATTGQVYQELFPVSEPGPLFSIVVWNASGVASDATNANHLLQWVPIVDEAQ